MWVFAYKLLVHNRVSFAENRIRRIQEIVGNETHEGIRCLIVCKERFCSQSYYVAKKIYRDKGPSSQSQLQS